MKYISAKRKDGSSARVGDRVLLILRRKEKLFGTITSLYRTMRFSDAPNLNMQIYRVRCDDGLVRPVYPRLMKAIFPKKIFGRNTPLWQAA